MLSSHRNDYWVLQRGLKSLILHYNEFQQFIKLAWNT